MDPFGRLPEVVQCLGAPIFTFARVCFERRSASMSIGPTAPGTRNELASFPSLSKAASSASVHRSILCFGLGRTHLHAQVLAEAQTEVLDELLPTINHISHPGIGHSYGSVPCGIAYFHPVLSHVFKPMAPDFSCSR